MLYTLVICDFGLICALLGGLGFLWFFCSRFFDSGFVRGL